jgi:predicted ATPase
MTLQLRTARIENFKSLGDVELPFKNLTILVGSNNSGKSNFLESLRFLRYLLLAESFLTLETLSKVLRFGNQNLYWTILVEDEDGVKAEYSVAVTSNQTSNLLSRENLKVNGIEVINIIDGIGEVRDEDGNNYQPYHSEPDSIGSLALRSAGNFGNKPLTKKLAAYIRGWKFYNVDPDEIRKYSVFLAEVGDIIQKKKGSESTPILNSQAKEIQEILNYWAKNETNKVEAISEELQLIFNISLTIIEEGNPIVKVLEDNEREMPLSNMSDGTLRLLAYLILLYQSELDIPTLIGIEEPERNLHPGMLKFLASILKRLSEKTQVVFTTHSSQLLDCFESEAISNEISVILLRKKDKLGTKVCLLEKLAQNHDDLYDWMTDFGLGSAIYHSHLIEEILAS